MKKHEMNQEMSQAMEEFFEETCKGRYFAKPPMMEDEDCNPILKGRVLRLLMVLGGVTNEQAMRWLLTEANSVQAARTHWLYQRFLGWYLIAGMHFNRSLYPVDRLLDFVQPWWKKFKRYIYALSVLFMVLLSWMASRHLSDPGEGMAPRAVAHMDMELKAMSSQPGLVKKVPDSRFAQKIIQTKQTDLLPKEETDYLGIDLDGDLSSMFGLFPELPLDVAVPKFSPLPKAIQDYHKDLSAAIKASPLNKEMELRESGLRFKNVPLLGEKSKYVQDFLDYANQAYQESLTSMWDSHSTAGFESSVDGLLDDLENNFDETQQRTNRILKAVINYISDNCDKVLLKKLISDRILARLIKAPGDNLPSLPSLVDTSVEMMKISVVALAPKVPAKRFYALPIGEPHSKDSELLSFDWFQSTAYAHTDLGQLYCRFRVDQILHSAFVKFRLNKNSVKLTQGSSLTFYFRYLDRKDQKFIEMGRSEPITTTDQDSYITQFKIRVDNAAYFSKNFSIAFAFNENPSLNSFTYLDFNVMHEQNVDWFQFNKGWYYP